MPKLLHSVAQLYEKHGVVKGVVIGTSTICSNERSPKRLRQPHKRTVQAIGSALLAFDKAFDSTTRCFVKPDKGRRGCAPSVVDRVQQDCTAATAIYPIPDEITAALARSRLRISRSGSFRPSVVQVSSIGALATQ